MIDSEINLLLRVAKKVALNAEDGGETHMRVEFRITKQQFDKLVDLLTRMDEI